MAEHEHAHYKCESCESVFCTDDKRYFTMTEGDPCPKCHVAIIARLPDQLPEDGTTEHMERMVAMLGSVSGSVDFGNILIAASRVYPYMTQDFTDSFVPPSLGGAITPNDGRRASAAVEVAFLMADMIVARMKAKAVEEMAPPEKKS